VESETVQKNLTRQEIAELLAEFERRLQTCSSQRQIAEELGIPRSTLQHWLERRDSINADPHVLAFFESPAGTAFLHRLVLGAHFVMTLMGPSSVRLVCQYLELTGLDRFIASSYCPQYKVSAQMEEAVIEFSNMEKARLAEGMEQKEITVCQDETFHPETCLVAIEPVSNFILLEKYSESRKSEDWTASMKEALEGLPVEIVQSVSDEGSGILHHVKKELGAHHSPDVFHVQHEIVKGTSAALAAKTECAMQALDKASAGVSRCISEKEAYLCEKHGPGRPPEFDKRIEEARKLEQEARRSHETISAQQERVKNAVQKIGEVYHPFDLETGALKTSEEASSSLNECFSEIETTASDTGLSDRCLARIKKAKKVVVGMAATIVFYLLAIREKVGALSLAPEVERAVFENLIPAAYIRLVSMKAKWAEDQERLRKRAEELMVPLLSPDGPFFSLDPEERMRIEKTAEECAQLFQRSSSCVEGRNGQLSLRHHSLHRLSNRKLSALTAVHNYMLKRSDGTTAAERFFGAKPKEMFEYLLSRVDLPGWPAQKRS
jgi:transcriptional regulator with XRE-family HTH domain